MCTHSYVGFAKDTGKQLDWSIIITTTHCHAVFNYWYLFVYYKRSKGVSLAKLVHYTVVCPLMMRQKNDAAQLWYLCHGSEMHENLVGHMTAECSADESVIWLEN